MILAFVDLVLEMFLSKISTRLLTIRPCTIPSRPLAIFLVAKLRKIPPMANPRYKLIQFYFIHEVMFTQYDEPDLNKSQKTGPDSIGDSDASAASSGCQLELTYWT